MSDQRLGSAFRAVRMRRRWRQADVAEKAGVSSSLVSLIERGHVGTLSLAGLRRVASVLDIRVDVVARWRGGELDRLLNARHSRLQNAVARWLMEIPGWVVVPEVSFAYYGERGWIDLLAWHQATGTLLVIEIKTEIVDVQELIGILDRKVRLAPRIARDRGWSPHVVAKWLVVADSSSNRQRATAHSALIDAAFPARAAAMRDWLRNPSGRAAGLTFFRNSNPDGTKGEFGGFQRVRVAVGDRT